MAFSLSKIIQFYLTQFLVIVEGGGEFPQKWIENSTLDKTTPQFPVL